MVRTDELKSLMGLRLGKGMIECCFSVSWFPFLFCSSAHYTRPGFAVASVYFLSGQFLYGHFWMDDH